MGPLLVLWLLNSSVSSSHELGVVEQPLPATLAAEAGLLVPAKWRRRVELVVRVRPHHAGLQFDAHLEDARSFVCPHASAQPVRRVVRLLDRFLDRAERQDAEHRAEDLFARDAMAHGYAAKDRRPEIKSFRRQATGWLKDLRAFLAATLHQLLNFLQLGLRVDRADVRI